MYCPQEEGEGCSAAGTDGCGTGRLGTRLQTEREAHVCKGPSWHGALDGASISCY